MSYFRPIARLLACTCLLAMATNSSLAIDPPAAVLQAEQARIQTIDRAMRTAVCVFAKEGSGGGSGVVISPDGYALTNFHVVQPAGSYMKCSMADDKLYDAVVVGIDPVGDVALIKLLGRSDFPAAPLANSDLVRAGDWCFAVGNPFLLATDFQPTVTRIPPSAASPATKSAIRNPRRRPPCGLALGLRSRASEIGMNWSGAKL